mgnify:CR=1 FL=1
MESCEGRIDKRLNERLEEIQENMDRVSECILSIDRRIEYTVCLSWGGPADYFIFHCNEDGEVVEIRYRLLDWFDGAERIIPVDSTEGKLLVSWFQSLGLHQPK